MFFQGLADRRGGRAALWILVIIVLVIPVAYLLSVIVNHL
jgi:hypothetical protein